MRNERGAPPFTCRRELDIEPVARRLPFQSLRPFDQRRGRRKSILKAQLPGILRPSQPIKVDMPQFAARALIGLHKRVSGAGRVLVLAGPSPNRPSRQRGFARAEAAREANHVTKLHQSAQTGAKRGGGMSIRERDAARINEGGCGHGVRCCLCGSAASRAPCAPCARASNTNPL